MIKAPIRRSIAFLLAALLVLGAGGAARAQKTRLRVAGRLPEAVLSLARAMDPSLEIEVLEDWDAAHTMDALISSSGDIDLFVLDTRRDRIDSIIRKGYLIPLREGSAAAGFLRGAWPSLQRAFSYSGQAFLLPLDMEMLGFAYQPEAFSQIGLEQPRHFAGLTVALSAWQDGLWREYPEYSFGQTENLRRELLLLAFDLYLHSRRAEGGAWSFDDPLFRELIGSITRFDAASLRELSALSEEERDLYPGFSILPLIDTNWRYLPQQEHERLSLNNPWKPAVLPIDREKPPALRADFSLLGVSAFSAHREEALSFLESCVSALPQDFAAALSPGRTQAIENPRSGEELQNLRSVIQALKEDIALARERGANPSGYEQDLAYFESLMARSEQTVRYLLTEEEVKLVHEKMALAYIPDDLSRAEDDSGIRAGFESFIDGAIPLELFISQSDNALRLIRAEAR